MSNGFYNTRIVKTRTATTVSGVGKVSILRVVGTDVPTGGFGVANCLLSLQESLQPIKLQDGQLGLEMLIDP